MAMNRLTKNGRPHNLTVLKRTAWFFFFASEVKYLCDLSTFFFTEGTLLQHHLWIFWHLFLQCFRKKNRAWTIILHPYRTEYSWIFFYNWFSLTFTCFIKHFYKLIYVFFFTKCPSLSITFGPFSTFLKVKRLCRCCFDSSVPCLWLQRPQQTPRCLMTLECRWEFSWEIMF